MNSMLLGGQQLLVTLPESLGGGNQVYNKVIDIINPTPLTDFLVPTDLSNKNDCLLVGEAWNLGGWTHKTSAIQFYLAWNNFGKNSGVLFGGISYTANTKIKIAKKLDFGAIQNNQMRYTYFSTGSANAARGWEVNYPTQGKNARCDLKIYYN